MGAVSAGGGGSPGEGVWGGFTFNPAPLVLNGQSVSAPDLQFSDPVAISSVDQSSQAYNFTNNLINNAYSFVGAADASVQDFNEPLFNQIFTAEQGWGNSLTASIQTEANALATAASNVGNGGGGGGGGILGSILGFL